MARGTGTGQNLRMRALKIIGIGIAALVALLVAGAAAVVLWVDPNAYRGNLEALAQEKTGRHLQIGGQLGLKIFPYLALSIADVQLGNPPGYGSAPFVTVRRASVGVRLLPFLVHKRLEVSRVSVDGLTALLVSRSDTDNNWNDLTRSKSGSAEQGGGEG